MHDAGAVVALVAILMAGSIPAEAAGGGVGGVIHDGRGHPVADAIIILAGAGRDTVSARDGSFAIPGVGGGLYQLIVLHPGFARFASDCKVDPGRLTMQEIVLQETTTVLQEFVVTGTRSERTLATVPIETSVLRATRIRAEGARQLQDILSGQLGMAVSTNQWGTGVQVEGLDPAYTLVLVDGEPVVGRSAGTVELSRVTLAGVDHVEIVRGPSSSLYGSEALAGVINVITRTPSRTSRATIGTRYGTFNALDLSVMLESGADVWGASVSYERRSTDGYSLVPGSDEQTMPARTDHAVQAKVVWEPAAQTHASITGRLVSQTHRNTPQVLVGAAVVSMDEQSSLLDWSVGGSVRHVINPAASLTGKVYVARYRTSTDLTVSSDGTLYDSDPFDQRYLKAEAQCDLMPHPALPGRVGGGIISETVAAARITGDARVARSGFLFGEQEWIPSEVIDLLASLRFDAHSDYAPRVSPKIALLVKPASWFTVRTSVGAGFKAPTFQQLFMDFTNPQVGYSVFGTTGAADELRRLESLGLIQSVLVRPEVMTALRPERSLSLNASAQAEVGGWLTLRAAVFHNALSDMIEASPFAIKTNGQPAYTYFNRDRVLTRGFDAGAGMEFGDHISAEVSYEYLEAVDRDVQDDVQAGRIFKTGSTGRVRPVQEVEYGGLFNRSRHSGAAWITYLDEGSGTAASLRCTLHGRYGFGDRNGNAILDDDTEYAPGYALWSLSCSRRLSSWADVQAGVENLFDFTDPTHLPWIPGRLCYAGVMITIQ